MMRGTRQETATVYVVDDEPAIRNSLEVLLRAVGLRVQTFASAREFLDAPVAPAACLILDLRMPEIDGFELTKRIAGTAHDLPTIIITGDGNDETRRRAHAGGAVAFLHKPFDDDALLDAIHSALGSLPGLED